MSKVPQKRQQRGYGATKVARQRRIGAVAFWRRGMGSFAARGGFWGGMPAEDRWRQGGALPEAARFCQADAEDRGKTKRTAVRSGLARSQAKGCSTGRLTSACGWDCFPAARLKDATESQRRPQGGELHLTARMS